MAQAPVQVSSYRPQLMQAQPGIGRDGTRLAQKSYIDAVWCRFYQSLPRKMGGYREQLRSVNGVVRAIDIFTNDGLSFVHLATGNVIERYVISIESESNSGLIDRTPDDYIPNVLFNWQLSQMFDIPTDTTVLFASGTPSALSITTSSEHPVYHGDIILDTPLEKVPDGTSFNAVITGSTLVVTELTRGRLEEGVKIYGTGVAPDTVIVRVIQDYAPPVPQDPLPPVPGTYALDTPHPLGAPETIMLTVLGAVFVGSISASTTADPVSVLTINDIATGSVGVGDEIYGTGVIPSTKIQTITTPFTPAVPQPDLAATPGIYIIDPAPQTVALTTMTAHRVMSSGGCCAVGLTLFLYGHDGVVRWSTPVNPLDFLGDGAGDARPVGDKIVKGMPIRGQSGPAIVMWSLSSVIIGSFVGTPNWWDFTTVTTTSSILSSNGVIEHEGIYYWPTTSNFSLFNGVVREIPNADNKQWFFKNLNWKYRQKVFGFKIPRWTEFWWCFPRGNAVECNWAIIYNWVEKRWYDTPLPNGGRSAGHYEFVYNYPIMAGVDAHSTGRYSMWQHESGLNDVSGDPQVTRAIRSYYQTNEFNVVLPQQIGGSGTDQGMSYSILEPDFDQVGDLSFTAVSRSNARAKERRTGPITIKAVPTAPDEQLIKFKHSGRFTSFIVESNVENGDYITGAPLIHWQPGDARRED